MASGSFLDPVDRETTPSIIARRLRDAISHGQIAPGTRLAEMQLAREFGVSRGPLREAMQRLTQEGLLHSIRNHGLFVIELTEDDVRDIYVARTAVDCAAAAQVLLRDHTAARARLWSVIEQMALAAEKQDVAGIGRADLEFHEVLVRLSESARLIRIHQTLLTETQMCVIALEGTYPETDDRVPEHKGIADAIGDGDAKKVTGLIVAHMDDAVARLAPKFPSEAKRQPSRG